MAMTPHRPLRPGRPLPRPAGALAVLSFPYVPRELEGCREHVFRLEPAMPTRDYESDSGWIQRGECLICGRPTPLLDASWWERSPEPEAVAAAIQALAARRAAAPDPAEREAIDRRLAALQGEGQESEPSG